MLLHDARHGSFGQPMRKQIGRSDHACPIFRAKEDIENDIVFVLERIQSIRTLYADYEVLREGNNVFS